VWERLTGMKKLLLKIIIVIACVVGFAFGGAFIGLEAHDLELTGKHIGGDFLGGVVEALLGLCIGAIIGGVVGWEAARKGDIKAVKHHLDAGVDVNLKDEFGKQTPLHEAATYGHKEVAELLIAKGADVNAKDDDGVTPLFDAALLGHTAIAELLIEKGADVNAKDMGGKTALDKAIINDETKIADLLRKHGGKTGAELKAEGK